MGQKLIAFDRPILLSKIFLVLQFIFMVHLQYKLLSGGYQSRKFIIF